MEALTTGGTLSDAELLRRWLIEGSCGTGPISLKVFARFRDLVRLELERLGLSPLDAAQCAPLAFAHAEATRSEFPPETTLRDRLLAAAHAVIHSTNNEAAAGLTARTTRVQQPPLHPSRGNP